MRVLLDESVPRCLAGEGRLAGSSRACATCAAKYGGRARKCTPRTCADRELPDVGGRAPAYASQRLPAALVFDLVTDKQILAGRDRELDDTQAAWALWRIGERIQM